MAKSNPLLESYARKLETVYKRRQMLHAEIDTIALLLAANKELHLGPKRAGFFLAEYLSQKMQIADALMDDIGDVKHTGLGDPEMVKTRHDMAMSLKRILGQESWDRYKQLFLFLEEFWEVDY